MRYFIPVISLLFIFSSCKDKNSETNLNVYRVAEEGLQRSTKNISVATEIQFKQLEEKLYDPSTKYKAAIWQPKGALVKFLSDSMVKYLNGLKDELKNEAGGYEPGNKNWENSPGVSEHLFESHGKGKELLEALINYKKGLLAIDPILKNQLHHMADVFSSEFSFAATDTVIFTKTFFSGITVMAANMLLSKFVNSIRICENIFVRFCYNQIGSTDGGGIYDKFAVIAAQSSNYLRAGEELEIAAGVGSFSDVSKPTISINNVEVPLNDDAVAIYKLRMPKKAGKYSVPVKIEFTSEDGSKKTMTKTISYTVID